MFGATSGTIEDVVLENVSINYVGGNHSSGYGFRMGGALVGYSMGDIVNCTVIGLDMKAGSDGSYVALNSIGGLVGIQDGDTTVSHSRVSGKIEESTKKGKTTPYITIVDRREAIHWAIHHAEKDDIIVLAGKGHEDYQILAGGVKIHFDEREVVADALKELEAEGR